MVDQILLKFQRSQIWFLSAIVYQIELLKNAFYNDVSDPEISSDTSEERDFERDFDSKTGKKRSKTKKKMYFRHGISGVPEP